MSNAQHVLLTDDQVWFLVNALQTAAEQYRKDAAASPELRVQFERQVVEARGLADLLQGADVVVS